MEEEIGELREALAAGRREEVKEEVGDLLFTIANLARKVEVDPEAALAGTNLKFRKRFAKIEEGLAARGKTAAEASLEEMDALWEAAKKE
jgi:ATP diphosphatase